LPKIGDVMIDLILDVDRDGDANATEHALEEGEPITDHVNAGSKTINISGEIKDKTGSKRTKLEKYRDDGKLLDFNFTSRLENVLILKFSTKDSSEIKDGYSFNMTLKQVRISKRGGTTKVKAKAKQRTKAKKNAGRVQVKK